jgi:hypothetical protein
VSFYGYRYYGPNLGRWISRDQLGEEQSANLFAVLSNSTIGTIDVLGLAKLNWQATLVVPKSSGFPTNWVATLGAKTQALLNKYGIQFSFTVKDVEDHITLPGTGGGCIGPTTYEMNNFWGFWGSSSQADILRSLRYLVSAKHYSNPVLFANRGLKYYTGYTLPVSTANPMREGVILSRLDTLYSTDLMYRTLAHEMFHLYNSNFSHPMDGWEVGITKSTDPFNEEKISQTVKCWLKSKGVLDSEIDANYVLP